MVLSFMAVHKILKTRMHVHLVNSQVIANDMYQIKYGKDLVANKACLKIVVTLIQALKSPK